MEEHKEHKEEGQQINLEELGVNKQSMEFYKQVGEMFNTLHIYDRLLVVELIIKCLFNKDVSIPPTLMALMMEKFQSIEIECGKWKKMLGEQRVKGLVCKKCGSEYPEMTMLQLATGINNSCEDKHNTVEISF